MKRRTECYYWQPFGPLCAIYGSQAQKSDFCEQCNDFASLKDPENFELLKKIEPNAIQVTLWKHWFTERNFHAYGRLSRDRHC